MFNGEVTNIENEINEETGNETDVLLYTVTYEDGDRYGRRRRPARPVIAPRPQGERRPPPACPATSDCAAPRRTTPHHTAPQ